MRKAALGAVVVLLFVLLAAVLAGQWLQRSLTAAGIEQLDWQQLRWSDGALQLGQLGGAYATEQGRLGFRLEGIRLQPVWRGGPRVAQLRVEHMQLVWQPAANLPRREPANDDWSLPALADLAGPLAWLPDELSVDSLQLQLPCEGEFCTLLGDLQLTSRQQPLMLDAQLDLQADAQRLHGSLRLQEQNDRYLLQAGVDVPQPLLLAGLGQLSGSAEVDLENRGDEWLLREGQADWRLTELELDALNALPAQLRPSALSVQVTPLPGSLATWQESIALAVRLKVEGAVSGQLDTALELVNQPQWQARLSEARLQLAAQQLAMSGVQAQGLGLDWPFQAQIDSERLTLQLGSQALLTATSLSLADAGLQLAGLRVGLGEATLALPLATPAQLNMNVPLQLGASRLSHAALKPQGWNLLGTLRHSAAGSTLEGRLSALSGLNSDVRLDWPSGEHWRLDLKLGEIFLRAADPLVATFAEWPALLSFSSGRISGQLQATGRDGLERLTGRLTLTGGQGIYDRASFSGLSLPLDVSLQGERLRLATEALSLSAVDPGLPLGPVSASGIYTATLSQPAAGVLDLRSASIGVLDGRVHLEPAAVDLGQARQTLVAVVQGVELARLFEVYPAEGLSGQGTLDGRFPVTLADGKLLVEDGRLQARQPGGVLRYQAQQLRDLAASNPNLEQLAAALDNFHYQVLASDVSYDEQGVLVLGLRLEGSNPAFQQGRPVHLNIRLEEDIPALLTSLQLSGQVSEIIRNRVQQHYLQRRNP